MKTKQEIRQIQKAINRFGRKHPGLDIPKLIEDGDNGQSTQKAGKHLTYLLGFGPKKVKAGDFTDEFLRRLKAPEHVRPNHPNEAQIVKRGKKRRRKRRAAVLKNTIKAVFAKGTTFYDGRPIAKWLVPYCEWARNTIVNGRKWVGRVVSAFREPAYSEGLCYNMCNRPSCPGRCAGRASGHSQKDRPGGCLDVSDYEHFRIAMRVCPLTPKLINDLPIDRVHFSVTGH